MNRAVGYGVDPSGLDLTAAERNGVDIRGLGPRVLKWLASGMRRRSMT